MKKISLSNVLLLKEDLSVLIKSQSIWKMHLAVNEENLYPTKLYADCMKTIKIKMDYLLQTALYIWLKK